MLSGNDAGSRVRGSLVPFGLCLAVALPVCAILLSNDQRLPTTLFVMAAIPVTLALYLQGALAAPRSIVLGGAVVLLFGVVLSTVVADTLPFARLSLQLQRGALILWFMYLAALIALARRDGPMLVVLLVAAVCGGTTALNIGLYLAGDPASVDRDQIRFIPAIGLVGSHWATTASTTYAVLIAAALAIIVQPGMRRGIRIAAAASAVAMAGGLVLTQTRGGYLSLLAGVLTVGFFLPRRGRLIVGAVLAALVLVSLYPPIFEALLSRGVSYRTGTWLRYLELARSNPIFGIGLIERVSMTVDGIEIPHPHNLFLSAQVRGGLISLIGIAAMFAGALYWAWAHARRFGAPMVLAMTVTLTVAAIFDYDFRITRADWFWATIWLPLALAAGCELAMRREREATAGPPYVESRLRS